MLRSDPIQRPSCCRHPPSRNVDGWILSWLHVPTINGDPLPTDDATTNGDKGPWWEAVAALTRKAGWVMLLFGSRDGNGDRESDSGQRHLPTSDLLGVLQSWSVPLQESGCTRGTISGLGPSSAFTEAASVSPSRLGQQVVGRLQILTALPTALRHRLGWVASPHHPPDHDASRLLRCCARDGNEVTTSMVPVPVPVPPL